jgi:hypothetical protein
MTTADRLRIFLGLPLTEELSEPYGPFVQLMAELAPSIDRSKIPEDITVVLLRYTTEHHNAFDLRLYAPEKHRSIGGIHPIILPYCDIVGSSGHIPGHFDAIRGVEDAVGHSFETIASTHVWLDPEYKNLGIARALYEICGRLFAEQGHLMVSGSYTGMTSSDAQRVWRGICRRHPETAVCPTQSWDEIRYYAPAAWFGIR